MIGTDGSRHRINTHDDLNNVPQLEIAKPSNHKKTTAPELPLNTRAAKRTALNKK